MLNAKYYSQVYLYQVLLKAYAFTKKKEGPYLLAQDGSFKFGQDKMAHVNAKMAIQMTVCSHWSITLKI